MSHYESANTARYYKNTHGETIENIGGVACNENFWDCECQRDYIHPATEASCPCCQAAFVESPPAREDEVQAWRNNNAPI